MSKKLTQLERFTWLLLQSIWVGGIWLTMLIILPSLSNTLVSPLLIQDIVTEVLPRIMMTALCCITVQLLFLIRVSGMTGLFKEPIGIGLLIALLAGIVFFIGERYQMATYQTKAYSCILIGLSGLFSMFHLPPWLDWNRCSNECKCK